MARTFVPEQQQRAADITALKNTRPTDNRVVTVDSDADGVRNLFLWDPSGEASNADGVALVESNITEFADGGANEGLWRRIRVPMSVSDGGTSTLTDPSDLNFGTDLSVNDDGDGTVTVNATGTGSTSIDIDDSGADVATGVNNLNFGANLDVTDDGSGAVTIDASGSATDTRTNISDDGTEVLTDVEDINFGTNLSVTDDTDGTVTIDASGGGGSVEVQDNGATSVSDVSVIDFQNLLDVTEPGSGESEVAVNDDLSQYDNSTSSFISDLSSFTTDDLTEGSTNEYHTDQRAIDAVGTSTPFANADLSNSEVTINGNSVALGNSLTLDTDDIGEGANNLYFTDERAQDAAAAALTGGTNTTVTYDDANDTITIDSAQLTDEEVQDSVFNNVLSGTQTLITVTYQDADNEVDYVVNNDLSQYDNSTSGFISGLDIDDGATDVATGVNNLIFGTNLTVTDGTGGDGTVTIDASGGSTSPAGSDNFIQINNEGSFGVVDDDALSSLEPTVLKITEDGDQNKMLVFGEVDESTVGENSLNIGSESGSSEFNSVGGTSSLAVGGGNSVSSDFSGSIGEDNSVSGANSFAVGGNNIASSTTTFVAGDGSEASGLGAMALGDDVQATAFGAFAGGSVARARNFGSVAIGSSVGTNGFGAVAMGSDVRALGGSSIAVGSNVASSGFASVVHGDGTEARGGSSAAMGFETTAFFQATALGNGTTAHGQGSLATGWNNRAFNWAQATVGGENERTKTASTSDFNTATQNLNSGQQTVRLTFELVGVDDGGFDDSGIAPFATTGEGRVYISEIRFPNGDVENFAGGIPNGWNNPPSDSDVNEGFELVSFAGQSNVLSNIVDLSTDDFLAAIDIPRSFNAGDIEIDWAFDAEFDTFRTEFLLDSNDDGTFDTTINSHSNGFTPTSVIAPGNNLDNIQPSDRVFVVGIGGAGDNSNNNLNTIGNNDQEDGLYVTWRDGTFIRNGLQVEGFSSGSPVQRFTVAENGDVTLNSGTSVNEISTSLSGTPTNDRLLTESAIDSNLGVEVENDGTSVLTGVRNLNFGSNLTATDDGDGTVTIDATDTTVDVQEDGGGVTTGADAINFTTGFSVSDSSGTAEVALDEDLDPNQGTFSPDGSTTTFNVSHGLGTTPTTFFVTPASADANGAFHATADSSNVTVIYETAPASGTDNVVLNVLAIA